MSKIITQKDKDHYQKLHEIAFNFSFDTDTDNEGLDYLIKSYEGLIWKFINEVKNDELRNINDRKIRNFYKLYISKKELDNSLNVHKYNYSNKVKDLLQQRSKMLADLLVLIEDEDLYQESIIGLMKLADRYHDTEKASFHTYVDRVFHYEFFRVVKENIPKNFNVYNSLEILNFDYNDKYNYKADSNNDIMETENYINNINDANISKNFSAKIFKSLFSNDYFDINWINGITPSKFFSTLNFFERKIFKLYYIEGYTDKEVGNELGFSRIVINKRRNEAKSKVKEMAESEYLLSKNK
ncbi:MAG: hypothetical protein B6I28_00505 [Fusobacteriia bacterium 4572_132]|nr:MAG: hypothetical protein B6I28_00505 [Fusobacteriia bacterium 4572_132]